MSADQQVNLVKHVRDLGNDWEAIAQKMGLDGAKTAIVEYLRLNLDDAHLQSLGSIIGEEVQTERKAPPTEKEILQLHVKQLNDFVANASKECSTKPVKNVTNMENAYRQIEAAALNSSNKLDALLKTED